MYAKRGSVRIRSRDTRSVGHGKKKQVSWFVYKEGGLARVRLLNFARGWRSRGRTTSDQWADDWRGRIERREGI